jgi:TP901 family phage tail tape measure protein
VSEMSAESLLIVAAIRDELSPGLVAIREELAGVAKAQERVGATGETAAVGMNRAGAAAEASGRKLTAAQLANQNAAASFRSVSTTVPKTAAALALLATGAVYMATKFETAMTRVNTQAGASLAEVHRMAGELLRLAPQVGQSPMALADSLYHVESAGFRGAQALDMVRAAAHGAALGNADLGAVTQAMIASIASGIGGVKGADDAMALLNRTVGIGDMKMQALAQAMATGILPSARSAGLRFEDVAAALATITDNATPADEAATRLRMTFALMSAPTGRAVDALGSIGMKATTLAADMRKPQGLLVALTDLKAHLEASGKTAIEQNQVIEHAFGGGRTSGAILTLLLELDRLHAKYAELGTAEQRQAEFQAAWAVYTDTLGYKWRSFVAGLESGAVVIGQHLLPYAKDLLDVLVATEGDIAGVVHWLGAHQTAALMLAVVLGGMLIPRMLALVAAGRLMVTWNAAAIFLAVRGAVIGAAEAFAAAGGGVRGFGAAMTALNINPAIAAFTVLTAVALFFWQRQRQAIDAAKTDAQDWVSKLGASTSSLSDTEHAITAITNKIAANREKARNTDITPSGGNLFWGTTSDGKTEVDKLTAQTKVLTDSRTKLLAQAATLRTNETAISAAYGITSDQVEQMASRYGIDLSGALDAVGPKFDNVISSVRLSHDTTKRAALDIDAMASSATSAADAVTALKDSLDALSGNEIAADQAAIAFRDRIVTLEKALKTSHGSMSMHNTDTRAARSAFDDAVSSASQWAVAVQTAGGSTAQTAAALKSAIAFLTPFTAHNKDAATKVAALREELRLLQGRIDGLHGKHVDIVVRTHGSGVVSLPGGSMRASAGDTPGPRASRLGSAMAFHAGVDGGVPGKRAISSYVRAHSLGSPWSDHLTGRAYDLVGSNLGSYAEAARRAGGFAEFHGAGPERHLHVAVGDTPGPRGGRPSGDPGFGPAAGMTLIVKVEAGAVVVGAGADLGDVEHAVARGAAKGARKAIERARVSASTFGAH